MVIHKADHRKHWHKIHAIAKDLGIRVSTEVGYPFPKRLIACSEEDFRLIIELCDNA
jgi:hypothetical protein